MASRMRKAISHALIVLLTITGLVSFNAAPAAGAPSSVDSCLVINAQQELLSANFCSGDLVIPASVKRIRFGAFYFFRGAVSFEANSQLETVETASFLNGQSLVSIVLPREILSLEQFAVAGVSPRVIYLDGAPVTAGDPWLVHTGIYKVVVPRGVSVPLPNDFRHSVVNPFQIDCNLLAGTRDFIASDYAAVELHNCKDPRNPSALNPPTTMGYILNRGLNDSVELESADSRHRGVLRLRHPGIDGQRFAAVKEIDGSGFSISAFGDEFERPQNVDFSCSTASTLPAGVSLTSDCNFISADTTTLASSTTNVQVNWTARNGVNNSVDVANAAATGTLDQAVSSSFWVSLSLRKSAQLTAAQLYQMKLVTAKYSGTVQDWNDALASYKSLPLDQVPTSALDAGIAAGLALEKYEAGLFSHATANSAVSTFEIEAAPGSTFLALLRSRLNLQKVTDLVSSFETVGGRAQAVRQQILTLPSSAVRDLLYARFQARADYLMRQTSGGSGGSTSLTFSNPYRVERFTVPAGVTQLTIQLQGAEGSQGGADNGLNDESNRPERAGHKGLVTGTIGVIPGQILSIGVGGAAGVAPAGCLVGTLSVSAEARLARGGTNPFGGYGGGDGGTPGIDGCSGLGGAGGAATVVKVGDSSSPASVATLVAGGSAGSTGSSDSYSGPIGMSSFAARTDLASTRGQSPEAFARINHEYQGLFPLDGGGLAGGGGGALGGAVGAYNLDAFCGLQDFCPFASSPGQNSTSGFGGLTSSYVHYTFADQAQANGSVTISYVEPPVATPTPTQTPTPTSTPAPQVPEAPQSLKVKPFWKGAEVSWLPPTKDGGAKITNYEVTASTGQTCRTDQLSCRITGLSPGQLIEVSVVARNLVGVSKLATPSGPKVFAPLSLNLWQTKLKAHKPVVKLMNPVQLLRLRTMLEKDVDGFVLQVRVAKNGARLSSAALKSLLEEEVKALSGQLSRANLRTKVKIKATIVPGNPKAARPSVILLSTKP